MTPQEILDIPMQARDIECATVREYLKKLLSTLWEEGEGFSGKRPFGNSGWELDLYLPLIKAGVVKGKLVDDDEECWVEEFSDSEKKKANKLIFQAIDALH